MKKHKFFIKKDFSKRKIIIVNVCNNKGFFEWTYYYCKEKLSKKLFLIFILFYIDYPDEVEFGPKTILSNIDLGKKISNLVFKGKR